MKIITVIGARPQFVKAAVLSREFKFFQEINEIIIHTGQHFDKNMSDVFFFDLGIPIPKYNLGINSGTHASMTANMLIGLEKILIDEKPEYVLVYGDTNSTLAAALAASKLNLPVIHVEAGVRSGDISMPEEVNRLMTDSISKILICPNKDSLDRLQKIKMSWQHVFYAGDLMYDCFLDYKRKAINSIKDKILVTIHRQENTDSFEKIYKHLNFIDNLAKSTKNKAIFIIHPRIRNIINDVKDEFKNIEFSDPLNYFSIQDLLHECNFVITDSGGLQKEAFWAKKPCLTLRDTTEWTELVDLGVNKIGEIKLEDIAKWIVDFDYNLFESERSKSILINYGAGNAGKKIAEYINTLTK